MRFQKTVEWGFAEPVWNRGPLRIGWRGPPTPCAQIICLSDVRGLWKPFADQGRPQTQAGCGSPSLGTALCHIKFQAPPF